MTTAVTERPRSSVPLRGFRKIVLFAHLCLGLLLGLYFSLLGLTGSALLFKSELHRFFKPSIYYVAAPENTSRLALDKLARVFSETHPGISISSLLLPIATNDVLIIGYKAALPGQKKPQSMQTLIDPYTGKVMAEQLSGGWFFRTLHNLHAKLLLDDLGEDLHRCGVLAVFALLLSGAWLWWSSITGLVEPLKFSKVLSQFRQKVTVKLDGSFNRKIFDVHNVVGFFTAAVLFVLALTAASDLWHDQAVAIVGALTGGPMVSEEKGPKNTSSPSYDAMLATAKSARPNMVAVAITDKLGVRMVQPGEPYVVPRCVTVVVNHTDASLRRIEDPASLPLGQQVMAWLLPVHFGQWGRGVSYYLVKAIWFIVGLSPSILFASGVMMFMLKRGVKR